MKLEDCVQYPVLQDIPDSRLVDKQNKLYSCDLLFNYTSCNWIITSCKAAFKLLYSNSCDIIKCIQELPQKQLEPVLNNTKYNSTVWIPAYYSGLTSDQYKLKFIKKFIQLIKQNKDIIPADELTRLNKVYPRNKVICELLGVQRKYSPQDIRRKLEKEYKGERLYDYNINEIMNMIDNLQQPHNTV